MYWALGLFAIYPTTYGLGSKLGSGSPLQGFNGSQAAVAQGGDTAAGSLHATGVQDNAVTGIVAVQIGIDAALHRPPLAGFVRIDGRQLKVA